MVQRRLAGRLHGEKSVGVNHLQNQKKVSSVSPEGGRRQNVERTESCGRRKRKAEIPGESLPLLDGPFHPLDVNKRPNGKSQKHDA